MELRDPFLEGLLDVWRTGQIQLSRVVRWGRFHDEGTQRFWQIHLDALRVNGDPPKLRVQTVLQHTHAIVLLADILLLDLEERIKIDGSLIRRALLLHDHGEGELGTDVPYGEITAEHKLREYVQFACRFSKLGDLFGPMQRAFLLQYVLEFASDNPERPDVEFPEDAQNVIDSLAANRWTEALVLDFIEHFDYLMYAVEMAIYEFNPEILIAILQNGCSPDRMRSYVEAVPALGARIWTPERQRWYARRLSVLERSTKKV